MAALATAACNMITGADSIEFEQAKKGGAVISTGSAQNDVTTTTTGGGGAPSTTSSGSGAAPSTGSGVPSDVVPADGVTITQIALYQGVERTLMKNGAAVDSNVPIVAGRNAMLRIFYSAQASTPITARVTLGNGEPLVVNATLSGTSSQSSLGTTVNVNIPGARISNAAGFRVELLVPKGNASGTNQKAVYPAEGTAPLKVESSGSVLKVVLVPVQYGADGSNRLPDTSQQQIQRYRDMIYKLYPVPNVTITVKPALSWSKTVSPGGSGWDTLLDAVANHRQQSKAAHDEYYYGIFNAAPTWGQFCGSGCVAGLSMIAGANDPYARAGIGVGFTGEDSAGAAAHEIGHQHGRGHAPCGVSSGVDTGFPHQGAKIGAWGYDLVTQQLIPTTHTDFMSYCHPEWVSDYNFRNLFNRLKIVNGAQWIQGAPAQFERLAVDGDGNNSWLEPITLDWQPTGEPSEVTVQTPKGPEKRVGYFYPYSHIPGGRLLVPATKAPFSALSFTLGEQTFSVQH
jgi:hypothetical protein